MRNSVPEMTRPVTRRLKHTVQRILQDRADRGRDGAVDDTICLHCARQDVAMRDLIPPWSLHSCHPRQQRALRQVPTSDPLR